MEINSKHLLYIDKDDNTRGDGTNNEMITQQGEKSSLLRLSPRKPRNMKNLSLNLPSSSSSSSSNPNTNNNNINPKNITAIDNNTNTNSMGRNEISSSSFERPPTLYRSRTGSSSLPFRHPSLSIHNNSSTKNSIINNSSTTQDQELHQRPGGLQRRKTTLALTIPSSVSSTSNSTSTTTRSMLKTAGPIDMMNNNNNKDNDMIIQRNDFDNDNDKNDHHYHHHNQYHDNDNESPIIQSPVLVPSTPSFRKKSVVLPHSSGVTPHTPTTTTTTTTHTLEQSIHELEIDDSKNFDSFRVGAYKEGPACVLGNNLFLYSEPTLEQVKSFDLVINCAKELKDFTQVINSDSTIKTTYIFKPWTHTSQLTNDFIKLIPIIDDFYKNGKKILVHCQCGVSRSASLIVAYIMKYKNFNLNDAYNDLKSKAPLISPNMTLIFQLMEWNNILQGTNNTTNTNNNNSASSSSIHFNDSNGSTPTSETMTLATNTNAIRNHHSYRTAAAGAGNGNGNGNNDEHVKTSSEDTSTTTSTATQSPVYTHPINAIKF